MASDFADMAERVRDLPDELRDQHERATEEAMQALRAMVRLNIRQNDSVARRVLISDVREGQRDAGGPQTITERSVHVPEWAKYLEHGTGSRGDASFAAPSNPPFRAIREWATAKPIVPRTYDTVEDAAYAIAVSISEEGLGPDGQVPRPFLDPAWKGPRGKSLVIRENEKAISRALRRL